MRRPAPRSALIVHPGLSSRMTLRRLLEAVGCTRIVEAEDGEQALQRFAAEPADLVLFTWELEGTHGAELMRGLRRRRRGRPLALVLLDEGQDQRTVVQAVKAGLAARLEAPWRAEPLRRILAELVWDWRAGLTGGSAG